MRLDFTVIEGMSSIRVNTKSHQNSLQNTQIGYNIWKNQRIKLESEGRDKLNGWINKTEHQNILKVYLIFLFLKPRHFVSWIFFIWLSQCSQVESIKWIQFENIIFGKFLTEGQTTKSLNKSSQKFIIREKNVPYGILTLQLGI